MNGLVQSAVRPATRIDSVSIPVLTDVDDGRSNVGLTALEGGGYVVHWLVEGNDPDRSASGLAVQRFAADGTKLGGVTVLQGLSPDLLNATDVTSYDLQALEGGGYVLTYALELEESGRFLSLREGSSTIFSLVGRPETISLLFDSSGARVTLSGTGTNGAPKTVALTIDEFNKIQITQAILDQFSTDNRLTLQVIPPIQSQRVSVFAVVEQDVTYSETAALVGVATSFVVNSAGFGVIATGSGRPETFRINSASFANGTGLGPVTMQVSPVIDNGFDLSGIPGAVRLPGGTIQIAGVAPDSNGDYRIPAALLAQLGAGDAQTILIVGGLTVGSTLTGTIGTRPATLNPEGLFVQTFNANGVALGDHGPRIDSGVAPVLSDVDPGRTNIGLTALNGGGYVVHWLVEGNGVASGIAVQRFAANGTKQGGVTVLQGLSADLLNAADVTSYDLQALDNGGYALTYALGLEGGGHTAKVGSTAANQTHFVSIVGRPKLILANGTPANASFALRGIGNDGALKTVALPFGEFRQIQITQAILDQFSVDNRMTLLVTGLNQGQLAEFSYYAEQDVSYNPTAALVNEATSFVVDESGFEVIGTTSGRLEKFHIDSASYANGIGPSFVRMQITPVIDNGIDLSGIAGATRLSNGTIQITGLTPDANGDYRVPNALLAQLGEGEARIILLVGGLTVGSTLTGTIRARPSIPIPEGLFVQTFNANGVALGNPGPRIDGGLAPVLSDVDAGFSNVGMTALDGGGFVVHWLVGDDEASGIAVQRFAANGAKLGGVKVLQGLSPDLLNGADVTSYDVQALDNRGYALTYALELERGGRDATVTAGAASQTLTLPVVGRPERVSVQSAPVNARFALSGTGNDGAPKTVALTVGESIQIQITQAILDQFGVDNRMNLQVTGLNQGESARVFISVQPDVTYNPASALADVATSFAVNSSGFGFIATGSGRLETFRINSASFANGTGPGSVTMQITPAFGFGFDLTGIAGATLLPSGTIQITGLTPDANGNYRIPPSLLAHLGDGDARITLTVGGLTAGSTLTGTIGTRPATPVPEGVFVQTFNANGVAHVGGLNLAGSIRADTIAGGAGDDTLTGGAGNDAIHGGAGTDVAVYAVARSQAVVSRNSDGSLTVSAGTDGIDTVSGVERFQFRDGAYSFEFGDPGGVLVANFAVGAGGWSSQDLYPRHLADVNGDGFSDIVGFGVAGVLVSLGNANRRFSAPELLSSNFGQTAGWASDNRFHRELADVNGDGRADIVGFGSVGTLVALAQANGSFGAAAVGVANFSPTQGWTTQEAFARTTGDVNGDGKADIIGFGTSGTLVALGNGDGTFQGAALAINNFGVAQGWTSDNQFHRAVADVNGDGFDDIVGFGFAGTLVALSNGDGTFDAATLALGNFGKAQGWASQDAFAREVADINNDGFADVIGFGIAGTLIAHGKTDGTFGPASFDVANFGANQGWTSSTSFHREIADINGDGFKDIVGFGFGGVLAGVNYGSGTLT